MRRMLLACLYAACHVVLTTQAARAESGPESICATDRGGIRLHVDGMYGGYPHSVLHDAVVRGVSCPSGAAQLHAFSLIADPSPHLRISVTRPIGQGQQGAISTRLFSKGHFVIGERMSLSPLARSQSPFSVTSDINLTMARLWEDLAARIGHGGPVIP
ncbi:hypothetical protein [Komagataeibacter oboediens]|uniref:hypothetical protein n=1 Tax=Komagataeibacter oboediens TaxID=65958 RepID=UPI0019AD034F|nr:hypothetical protein MSKU3_0272 [Komagataeibacter oboediens]